MDTNVEYLLDTQAIRSLPKDALDAAEAKGTKLVLSPISVWELLCHIDESEKEGEGWQRAKGRLLRARRCMLLDDPFAEHAVFVAVGGAPPVHPTRFDDRFVIPQVLGHLDSSVSLTEFYSREVTYPSGDIGKVEGCADRVRALLQVEETAHVKRCEHRRALILETFGSIEPVMAASDDDYLTITSAGSTSLANHYREKGITDEHLAARIFCSTFPHMAYVFERTRVYLKTADPDGTMHVDPNDTEDALLCLHLNVTFARVLVTDDKGTRQALGLALQRLTKIIHDRGHDVPVLTRVLSCQEFRSECDV